jgi:hypothetical protein
MTMNRKAVAALVGVGALLVGGGSALAGGGKTDGERGKRCQERVARAAEKHGMSAAELEAAIKARLVARVDAALAAGRIDAEQAAKLKQRIAGSTLCPRPAAKLRVHGLLQTAATYLGLTKAELRAQLPGTSLAALAAKQDKSVDGLKAALLAPAKARLARAVASGKLPQARADAKLARLSALVDRLVAETFPAG